MDKIPTIILFYKNLNFLAQMVHVLCKTDKHDIYILHNPSDEPSELEHNIKVIDMWLIQESIKKHILFDENIANNAVKVALKDGLIDNLDTSDFVILSDGDLLPDCGWLDEHLEILNNHHDVFVVGSDLYMDNLPFYGKDWIPPSIDRGDYLQGEFGTHLLTFRTDEFKTLTQCLLETDVTFCDTNYHVFGGGIGKKSAKTKKTKSVHLAWNLYNDLNHPYTKERMNNPSIWQTKKTCEYKVFTYEN